MRSKSDEILNLLKINETTTSPDFSNLPDISEDTMIEFTLKSGETFRLAIVADTEKKKLGDIVRKFWYQYAYISKDKKKRHTKYSGPENMGKREVQNIDDPQQPYEFVKFV
jgi:hypothetical protein